MRGACPCERRARRRKKKKKGRETEGWSVRKLLFSDRRRAVASAVEYSGGGAALAVFHFGADGTAVSV